MNMIQALNDAHKVTMRADDDMVVFGEDVGYFGGVFRVTEGLQKKFGKTRVFDTPIGEGGIIGTAVGMAAYGLQAGGRDPVRRLHLSRLRPDRQRGGAASATARPASSPRRWSIRTPYGGGICGGQTHSQSPEGAVHPHLPA